MEYDSNTLEDPSTCVNNFNDIAMEIITLVDGLHFLKFENHNAQLEYIEILNVTNNWRLKSTDQYHNIINNTKWFQSRYKEINTLCSTLSGYKINKEYTSSDKELFSKNINVVFQSISKQRKLLLINYLNSILDNFYQKVSQSNLKINLSFILQIPFNLDLDIENQNNQILEWRDQTISELYRLLTGFEVHLLKLIELIELITYKLINLINIILN
ncbi:hypothetical protein ACTFIU_001901 [Dictyostelium citrinum]